MKWGQNDSKCPEVGDCFVGSRFMMDHIVE